MQEVPHSSPTLGSLGFPLSEVIYSSVLSYYANSLFVPILECATFLCLAGRLPYAESQIKHWVIFLGYLGGKTPQQCIAMGNKDMDLVACPEED